jgi:hypothetical protein
MEESLYVENNLLSASPEISRFLCNPPVSSPSLQEFTNCSYPEPDQLISRPAVLLIQYSF